MLWSKKNQHTNLIILYDKISYIGLTPKSKGGKKQLFLFDLHFIVSWDVNKENVFLFRFVSKSTFKPRYSVFQGFS